MERECSHPRGCASQMLKHPSGREKDQNVALTYTCKYKSSGWRDTSGEKKDPSQTPGVLVRTHAATTCAHHVWYEFPLHLRKFSAKLSTRESGVVDFLFLFSPLFRLYPILRYPYNKEWFIIIVTVNKIYFSIRPMRWVVGWWTAARNCTQWIFDLFRMQTVLYYVNGGEEREGDGAWCLFCG